MMAKMLVLLDWDEEELGKDWMNIFNLELLLYSKEHTRRDLLKAVEASAIMAELCVDCGDIWYEMFEKEEE